MSYVKKWLRTAEDEGARDDPDSGGRGDVEIESVNDILEQLWDLYVQDLERGINDDRG